uniref:Protein kinase domain-containing protein n=1 Tax=Guillardia theta (strain CCMP2712) TaxID=905079 RepID=A0A0C3TT10_GUITC
MHDFYHIGSTLGKGSFAVVKEAQHKHTGVRVAIKMIDRSNPGFVAFDADALRKEIATMHRINHRNCIRLHEVFEEQGYICLVLDLVTGGELFDRIIARGHYSEKDAAEVSRDVLQAVAYLHAQGIVHRDLKPENLLYMSNDESMPEYKHIKVADFGLARCGSPDSPMRTMCGTPGYVAPEVLDPRLTAPHGYGPQIDVWSIGVVLYIMLCGFPPFYSENTVTLFRQIRRGDYSFPSPYWDNISDLAKAHFFDLVRRMLVVDPKQRLTAQQVIR